MINTLLVLQLYLGREHLIYNMQYFQFNLMGNVYDCYKTFVFYVHACKSCVPYI